MLNFLKYILIFICIQIITGGFKLEVSAIKLDLRNTDVFGILFLVTYGIGALRKYRYYDEINNYLFKIYDHITQDENSVKYLRCFLVYCATITFLGHAFKYYSYSSDGLDQAFVHKALFYPWLKGKLLYCDVCPNKTFFGEHTNFTFLLIAPLTMLFKSDLLVFFLNSLILYGGVYLLIVYGPLKNNKKLWFVVGLIILSSRSLRNAGVWDLREEHMGYILMVASLMFLYNKKILLYLITLTLVVMSKENLAYLTPFLAIPILFEKFGYSKHEKISLSLMTILISIVWMKLNSSVVVPYFNENETASNNIISKFDGIASTTTELIYKMITSFSVQKKLMLERVLTVAGIKYIALLTLPFIFSLKKKWFWFIAASPILAMNLLSYSGTQRMMIFHYDLVIIPIMGIAIIMYISEQKDKSKVMIPLLFALLVSGRWPMYFVGRYFPSVETIGKVQFVKGIKTKEYIGSSWRNLAYLTHNEHIGLVHFTDSSVEDFLNSAKSRDSYGSSKEDFEYLLIDKSIVEESKIYEKLIISKFELSKKSGSLILLKRTKQEEDI